MNDLSPTPANAPDALDARGRAILADHLHMIRARTDRMFVSLMILQYGAGVLLACFVSPRTWSGSASLVHLHVYAAVILGAVISSLPIYLCMTRPGEAVTRHVVAIAQVLWSALLIHLTGGRIETHFHIFGSLALIAFYRDWRVILTATLVVAIDHGIRGLLWPQSVFGVLTASPWRTVEHAGWVIFEDVFLIQNCLHSLTEMRQLARQRAEREASHETVEREVAHRTSELQRANEELASQQDELRHMMTELESMNVELEKARAKADEANASKSEFLANMSHEIRTPMTAIVGYTDMLLEEGDLARAPERRVAAIRTIQRNGDHLLRIVNDILDLSKIEANRMTVEKIPCAPLQLVSDVVSLMRVRAQTRNLDLKVDFLGPIPECIENDPTRLRQILINLVGNAIKFTETGEVRIEVQYRDRPAPQMVFDVVDTGVGISPEQAARLFQPFVQADGSMTRKFGGTGLGLSVSKRLAELLGGGVELVNSSPGRGARFRVVIDAGSVNSLRMIENPSLEILPAPKVAPATHLNESLLSNLRVLVAEDGVDNQRLIIHLLEKAGATVTCVDNGDAAVRTAMRALANDQPFDSVLMDMQMPVMDGYEATALLRAKGYPGPIIALTAHAMAEDRQRCLSVGCNDYATKPIDREKLIQTIKTNASRPKPVSTL